MFTLLAYLLVLVPAPAPDEPPSGPAPTLQFMKWNNGTFERTQSVPVTEKYVETVTVDVNGKSVTAAVEKVRTVTKSVMVTMKDDGVEVYGLDGKKLEKEAWQKALGQGAVVIISGDGEVPHPAYRKVFKEGMLMVVMKPVKVELPTLPSVIPPNPK